MTKRDVSLLLPYGIKKRLKFVKGDRKVDVKARKKNMKQNKSTEIENSSKWVNLGEGEGGALSHS